MRADLRHQILLNLDSRIFGFSAATVKSTTVSLAGEEVLLISPT
jgi:hypothetical protein